MAELMSLSSSDEIYIIIAKQLRFPNSNDRFQAQKDALSLALTCRRLKAVAYEVLYHTAIIAQRQEGDTVFGGSHLIRTLIRRPKLARGIKGLFVSVTGTSNRVAHDTSGLGVKTSACPVRDDEPLENCLCDWLQIAGRVVERLDKKGLLEDLDAVHQQKWLKGIRIGREPAIFGALLALLPNLRSLSIHKRGVVKDDSPQNFRFEPGSIDPWKMFGLSDMEGQSFFSRIPGFNNLLHLSANCLLPTCMVKLPSLQTLEISTYIGDSIDTWNPFEEDLDHDTYFATTIRKLTLSTDNHMLTTIRANMGSVIHELVYSIMEQASCLVDLFIKIVPDNLEGLFKSGRYQTLIDNISCAKIETLVIDNSIVLRMDAEIPEWVKEDLWRTIRPGRTLSNLRSLRKLVVPQEFLFDTNAAFAPCELCAKIEDISVVNTTTAIHQWAWHLLDNLHNYPLLKSITLWAEVESKAHFAADSRLDSTYFDGQDDEYSDSEQVSVTDEDSDGVDQSGDDVEDVKFKRDTEEANDRKEEDSDSEDLVNKEEKRAPLPFSGLRSRAWAKLQEAGISVTLDYHNGCSWDEL